MQKLSKLRNGILKYLVAAVLLGVPLYPKFPFIRVPGTAVSIRLEDFLILTLALATFFFFLPKLKEVVKDDLNRAIFLFLLVGFVSVVSGIFLTKTIPAQIGFLHWIRRIEYLVPFFAGMQVVKNDKGSLAFYLKLLIITVFFVFIYGYGQKHFSWPIIITQNEEYSKGVALRYLPGSHINSTFAGHYDLATYMVLVMPIMISAFLLLKGFWSKTSLFLALIAGVWLLVNAVSRISLVTYLLGVVASALLIKKYKAVFFVVASSLILMLVLGLSTNIAARYERIIDVVKEKVFNISFSFPGQVFAQDASDNPLRRARATPTPQPTPIFEDRSTSIRVNVEWPRAIRALAKNPLLGTGYSSITLATDNDYLRLLGEVGLIGFFAFSLLIVKIGSLFYKVIPLFENYSGIELVFVSGVLGALPGVLINALFIDVFEASKFAIIFWLLVGMAVQLVKDKIYVQ